MDTGQDLQRRRSCKFSRISLNNSQFEQIVTLAEDDHSQDNDKRRFRVVITFAAVVELGSIVDFCKGIPQSDASKEMMVSTNAFPRSTVAFRPASGERTTETGAQSAI